MILELAKCKMYHFWYNILKQHYREKVNGIYTDADSVIFSLECDDISQELGRQPLVDCIDTSNCSPQHPVYNNSHKGKLGFLKSEVGEKLISEVCCLKPKLY